MDFCTGSSNAPASQIGLGVTGTADIRHSPRAEEMVSSSTQGTSSPRKSPTCDQVQHYVRQNTVGNVHLSGVNIVSLIIDGIERLCLAQISNTLLKDFSYNEIHNRRVALGITCVQCTPVQLEILRRAGAMPISSRRCGMITKREAERLVKSFLEDTAPLKLPENFAFSVKHNCGWGCKGSFIPSRYNSSRAKCIKCTCCNIFFSPNKFIFHFHRTSESKYKHPDAANFNSWRRHIFLDYEESHTELDYAWEDVKAMFNGGSRKRLMGSSSPGSDKSNSRSDMGVPKRPRMEFPGEPRSMAKFSRLPYPYPVIPSVPGTSVTNTCPTGFIPRVPHPAFPFSGQGTSAEQPHFQQDPTKMAPNFADFWKTKGMNPYYNPLGLLWAKNFGLYGDAAMQYGNAIDLSRQGGQKISQMEDANKYMHTEFLKLNGCFPTAVDSSKLQMSFEHEKNKRNDVEKYMSAFRPVNKDGPFTLGDYKQLRLSSGSEEMDQDAMSPNAQSEHSDGSGYDLEEQACAEPEDIDINVTDIEQNDTVSSPHDINKNDVTKAEMSREGVPLEGRKTDLEPILDNDNKSNRPNSNDTNSNDENKNEETAAPKHSVSSIMNKSDAYYGLSQGDLQKELKKLVEERQKAEKEYQSIVDAFKSKCNPEADSKETMEQTIKEAHEALRHFSCKMMSLRNTIDYAKLGTMHE